MSSIYHTPYEDDSTQFKASHMNVPLGELDAQLVINAAAITALPDTIICSSGEPVVHEGNVVVSN